MPEKVCAPVQKYRWEVCYFVSVTDPHDQYDQKEGLLVKRWKHDSGRGQN